MNPLEQIIAYGNRPSYVPYETYDERRAERPNWILLGDGTVISVIAGVNTYCEPRVASSERSRFEGELGPDYPGPYTWVETWFPRDDEPEACRVDILREFVEKHGGVVSAHVTEDGAREAHR